VVLRRPLRADVRGRRGRDAGAAAPEESPAHHDPTLHGVQLWVALPDAARHTEPSFEHHADLPRTGFGGFEATVFAGALDGTRSPALTFSEIVGAELTAGRDSAARVPLAPGHEHVIFVGTGSAEVEGVALRPGRLLYLTTGRELSGVRAAAGTRLFLLGGVPLGEPLPAPPLDAVRLRRPR
jgi:redox-sensitive bicupin YhaK (pirin superfamily)